MHTTRHRLLLTVILSIVAIVGAAQPAQADDLPLELTLQIGHTKEVISTAFSPDGRYALSGSNDKTMKLWEVATGREVRTFGLIGDVNSVVFSPDGDYAISGYAILGSYATMTLWEVTTGREIRTFGGKYLALSPDGQNILSATRLESTLQLLEVSTGQEVRLFEGHSDKVTCAVFSPDGRYALSGSADSTMRFWDVNTGREMTTFTGHSGEVTSVVLSPDGHYALSGSADSTVRLWDVDSGREVWIFTGHKNKIRSVFFSPDGRFAFSGNWYRTKLCEVATGREVRTFRKHFQAFSPDGHYALSGDTSPLDNSMKLWEVATGLLVRTFEGHAKSIESIAISPDGKYVISGSRDHTLGLLELSMGREVRIFEGHSSFVTSVVFSPDGRYALSGSNDKTMKLWELSSGREVRTFHHGTRHSFVQSVAFSPDGRYALSGSNDKTMKLWEVATGRKIRTFRGHSNSVNSVAFSPDGRYALSGSNDETIKLWKVSSGRKIRTFRGHPSGINSVAFSPDGRYALSGSDSRFFSQIGEAENMKLWEVATGRELQTFEGHFGFVQSVAFSPDGRYALSGSSDKTLKLWEVSTGREVRTFEGHIDYVNSVVFSPDGRHAISGSFDGTIRFWSIETGDLMATVVATPDAEWAIVTPTGRFDMSGNFKGLYWVRGMEIIEIDQFFDDFYTPGLLAQVLSGEEVAPSRSVAEVIKQSPPPTVEIISPRPGSKLSQKTVEVQIKVTDTGGGIDEVKLLHNGKRVGGDTRGMKRQEAGDTITRSYQITLVKGTNEFLASAYSTGRVESRGYRLKVLYEGAAKTATSYIVAVGIDKYRNKSLNLNYARADASAFVELVTGKSQRLFNDVVVTTLYDGQATRTGVLAALDEVAGKAAPEDVFTFYYAGHGSVVDGRYYFVTSENVKLYDREKLDLNAIFVGELTEHLSRITALKQLIIMDACQSGAAAEALAFRGAAEEKALAQLARSAGVHVLASAGSEQFAAEFAELGHGVFTYVLLKGLNGAADGAPRDGKVTISELRAYLDDQVPEMTEKHRGEAQWPTTQSRGQDFPVVIN